MRFRLAGLLVIMGLALSGACGGSPSAPGPVNPPPGGGGATPPPNSAPVIQGIAVQGNRPRQPANFTDLGEAVDVTATVRDDETAAEQLQYNWTASTGTFNGTGARVTWQAPASASTPAEVTLRLELVERYGQNQAFEHRVSSTARLSLHDSVKEVGEMARQFLLDFSDSSLRDVAYVMRNFGSRCPDPREVANEQNDISNNRANFRIISSRIGEPRVTVNFGGSCPFRFKTGDACAVVPAFWESIDLRTNQRGAVDGNGILAASYSSSDARWWLCSSDYDGRQVSGVTLRGFIR